MRGESEETFHVNNQEKGAIDIIRETRKLVSGMSEKQRFEVAKRHLNDAFSYKTPRLDTYSNNLTKRFKFCYNVQTSDLWSTFLMIISYIFMYLIAIENHKKTQEGIEFTILIILLIDVAMEVYHKRFEVLRISSRFQARFYLRIVCLILLAIDEMIFAFAQPGTIRPFLVLRCLLPIFYDITTRKAFEALISSYKDITVYIAFYTLVIIGFAIIANQVIEIPEGTEFDKFKGNYGSLGKTIFIIYVLSSYDSYPDNQVVAINQSLWIYAFFIFFIFMNVFFFVTIPTTILFNSFRETRSKIILIDEIKQQHSLIMAFVSLGEENLNISQRKLISFLLYVYKNKVRYVDYITEVCLKLDDNNNGQIQVNEFMQLCKILQSNSSMMPPKFHDWECWLKLRKFANGKLKLKAIILSTPFKIVVIIFIILTFINCCLAIYTHHRAFDIIDDIFMVLYCLEICLKLIGLGPEVFFWESWNKLDFVLILIGLVLELTPTQFIPRNSDILFKMTRIFRITLLIKLLTTTKVLSMRSDVYIKSKKLISQMAIIIPIVLKFFPLYLIFYYALGVLGMQIFNKDTNVDDTPYGGYNQYSNFKTFIGSQFIFVQILVEAGWSEIAYNHAYRYGNNVFALTMLFFVFSHIIIVIVLSSLLKGLAWQVYATVHQEFDGRKTEIIKMEVKEIQLKKKKEEFQAIREKINENQLLLPDTLILRELYENRIDLQIFKKIKIMYGKMNFLHESQRNQKKSTVKRSEIISHFMEDRNIMIDEIQLHSEHESAAGNHHDAIISKLLESLHLKDIEDIQEEDIEEEMEKFLSKIILHHKIKYSEAIVYPKVFVEFLERKLQPIEMDPRRVGFNIDKDPICNTASINFLTYQLNVLLEIQNSEREQKMEIIRNMVNEKIIPEDVSAKILTSKVTKKNTSIDSNWIMRKMFLSDTNEELIKKFEIEYFSSVYGKSFKEINKVTIQPLLRLESRLIYCLKNALRYQQIPDLEFFTLLSTIEDTISNKLLKKGSLFKFVYQIDSLSDTWFSIQLKQSNELRIHFIKTGIWVYNKSLHHNEIKVAEDIFNWNMEHRPDKSHCEKYIKLFFQSFESLAFSLLNDKNFFISDPSSQVYDLFTFFRDVESVKRFNTTKLQISKVMLVILSREETRDGPGLEYELSDIKVEKEEDQSMMDVLFRFDESEKETFKKLKKIEVMDYEKIVETEGIPFTYIINLMKEIQQILELHEQNLVYQVEKVLNKEFEALT